MNNSGESPQSFYTTIPARLSPRSFEGEGPDLSDTPRFCTRRGQPGSLSVQFAWQSFIIS
jgi:hypothetical protein